MIAPHLRKMALPDSSFILHHYFTFRQQDEICCKSLMDLQAKQEWKELNELCQYIKKEILKYKILEYSIYKGFHSYYTSYYYTRIIQLSSFKGVWIIFLSPQKSWG